MTLMQLTAIFAAVWIGCGFCNWLVIKTLTICVKLEDRTYLPGASKRPNPTALAYILGPTFTVILLVLIYQLEKAIDGGVHADARVKRILRIP